MSLGSTFGGMGAASVGMDAGAQAENQRALSQQVQQHQAFNLRQMQEQDTANKKARADYDAQIESMQAPAGALPQAKAGATVAAPTASVPTPAPMVSGYAAPAPQQGGRNAPPAVSGNDYDAAIAQYQSLIAQQEAKLKAQRAAPNAQAQADNATLRTVKAGIGDAALAPLNVLANGATAASNVVNRGINAVTGKNTYSSQPYSSMTANLDALAPTETDDTEATLNGARQGLAKFQALKDAATPKGATFPPGSKVTPQQAAPVLGSLEQKYGLPPGILTKIMATESGGTPRPNAQGSGAAGYFQFMPETAKSFGVTVNDFGSEADGAARYMAALIRKSGDVNVALAQYGGGFVNGQVTPNGAAYAQKVLGQSPAQAGVATGAAPAQAAQPAQPAQPAPFQPQGAAQAYGGDNIDQAIPQLQQAFQLVKLQAQNTRDPQQKAQLMMQLHEIGAKGQDLQLQQLGRAATVSPAALNQLTGLFAGQTGSQFAVQQDGKGNVRLAMGDGTPAPGDWGKPMTLTSLIGAMQTQLSQSLTAQAAQRAAAYQAESDKWGAKAGAEGPWELEKVKEQGRSNTAMARIHGDAQLQQALLTHNLSIDEVQGATFNPSGDGSMEIRTKNDVFLYRPPAAPLPGMPATLGQVTKLNVPRA